MTAKKHWTQPCKIGVTKNLHIRQSLYLGHIRKYYQMPLKLTLIHRNYIK